MTTIARRLFRTVVPGIVLALVAGGVALDALIGARLEDDFDRMLETRVRSLMALTELADGTVELERYEHLLPDYADPARPEYFAILGPSGRTLARSPSLGERRWLVAGVDGGAATAAPRDVALPDGRSGRAVARRFVPGIEEGAGGGASEPFPVTLHVAVERESLDRLLASLRWVLLGTGLVLVAAIVALARRGIGAALAPLERLGEAVAALDPSRLEQRLAFGAGSVELGRLAARIDELLERLDAAFARERRFSADVAHELRTPLAELRTLGEVALRWPDDPALRRDFLADHAAAVARMERTVRDLLALARDESAVDAVEGTADLVAMLRETLAGVAPELAARSLTLAARLPAAPVRCAGETQWRVVLGNLVANAAEYAEPGSDVEVALERERAAGGTWRLTVANRAPGLEPADLPHLFERLWRKERARSSAAHAGLGLALAAACARRLGLGIRPVLDPAGRLSMRVAGIVALAPAADQRRSPPSSPAAAPAVAARATT